MSWIYIRDITAENAIFPFVSMYSCPPLTTAVVIVYRKYTIHTQSMTSNAIPLLIGLGGNMRMLYEGFFM